MKLENKKLILFDLDGTLIDSVPDLALSVNEMLKYLGRTPFEIETVRSWVGNGADILVKRALLGKRELNEPIEMELFAKALELFLKRYHQNLCVETNTFEGVNKSLELLKSASYRMAIVTNKPEAFVLPLLKALNLDDYFELIVGGDTLLSRKPEPEPLLYVCEKLGVSKEEAVMVGDSKNDILAAHAAGIESIAVTYGYNYEEDIRKHRPDWVIEHFSEIVDLFQKPPSARIAVVGGGIAGSSIALFLSKMGMDITLFEKQPALVDGPPMCHLHAGGNLYREISDAQCLQLLEESISFMRFYPKSIDYRPTVIAVPIGDKSTPQALFNRLELLKAHYEVLIKTDSENKVLGESEYYYKLYERADLERLKLYKPVKAPQSQDEWMITVSQHIDLDQLQFPMILVQEYGINLFRLAANVTLCLQNSSYCRLKLEHEVTNVVKENHSFIVESLHQGAQQSERFDYLINAAGFNSGKIDDFLGYERERFVEFKAAFVTQWDEDQRMWPEMVFYGERGTPQGMAQFTPYPDGYVQLHAMTPNMTLFEDGLVKSNRLSAQPQLPKKFIEKMETHWAVETVQERTERAIAYLARFIPAFKAAKVASKPLFGAQQIPGEDETLRAAEVSFVDDRYARCEIVKASSVLSMADTIAQVLLRLGYLSFSRYKEGAALLGCSVEETSVDSLAQGLSQSRNYPLSLAKRSKEDATMAHVF